MNKIINGLLLLRLKGHVMNYLESKGFYNYKSMQPIDFRGIIDSPTEALERANRCPIVVDIPLNLCRGLGLMAFSCSRHSNHPFIRTLVEYASNQVTIYQGFIS